MPDSVCEYPSEQHRAGTRRPSTHRRSNVYSFVGYEMPLSAGVAGLSTELLDRKQLFGGIGLCQRGEGLARRAGGGYRPTSPPGACTSLFNQGERWRNVFINQCSAFVHGPKV